MKRIHSIRAAILLLSVLPLAVFVAERGAAGLRFPHPLHQDVECSFCHEKAAQSQRGADNLLPGPPVCLGCHEQATLDTLGWEAGPPPADRFPSFSHEKHLAMKEIDCAYCHGALMNRLLTGTGKGEIGHTLCNKCHNGVEANQECSSCHADVQRLRPLDHGPDYLHGHQFSARASAGACEDCHRESESCSECHQGENVLFRTHARNYVFTHAQDARKHENDCLSCHELDGFCNDCHVAEGVQPTNHRTGWIGGDNRHAIEARRDIAYCAACHEGDDPACTRCHSDTGGRGDDASIHPDGFDDRDVKGPCHDDDGYYCYDCHERSSSPEGFCSYCHPVR